jgi:hypothetical protein
MSIENGKPFMHNLMSKLINTSFVLQTVKS